MSKRRHGKYRDSKHYRQYKTKGGSTAKVYTGGTASKTAKSSGSSFGGSTGGYSNLSKWGVCMDRHWQQPINIGDGLTVFGSSWVDSPHKAYNASLDAGFNADVGVYLDDAWAAVSTHLTSPGVVIPGLEDNKRTVLFHWRDYDVPESLEEFIAILRWTISEARTGSLIEVACFAGHGRTGTFLAGLMIMLGMTASEAIKSTKAQQCKKCIETTAQRELLYDLDERLNSRPAPHAKAQALRDALPSAKAETDDYLDEFGRRYPEVLNELDEEDAYEVWLRLNAQGERDYTWCDYEDLPYNLCSCPDKHDPDTPDHAHMALDYYGWS